MKRTWKMISGVCLMGALTVLAAMPASAETTATEVTVQDTAAAQSSYSVNVYVNAPGENGLAPCKDDATVRVEKRYIADGSVEVIDTWNIADSNPHTIQVTGKPYDDDKGIWNYTLYAVMEEVPHGYSYFNGQERVLSAERSFNSNDNMQFTDCYITLQSEPYADAQFPMEGTYSATVDFVVWDPDTTYAESKAFPENLEAALVDLTTGEELVTWNTADHPKMTLTDLSYRFEDWKMESTYKYGITVKNMPEDCNFNGNDPWDISYNTNWLETDGDIVNVKIEIITPEEMREALETAVTSTATSTVTTQTETTTTTSSEPETTTTTTTDTTEDTETTVWADYTSAPESETIATSDSDLPQTGNNSLNQIAVILGALLMLSTGAWAVRSAGSLTTFFPSSMD